jgi:probable HAF family extracellular repeat protein
MLLIVLVRTASGQTWALTELPELVPSAWTTSPQALNNRATAVGGTSYYDGVWRTAGCFWRCGQVSPISVPEGAGYAAALAINNAGQMAGEAWFGSWYHRAYLWRNDATIPLGFLGTGQASRAQSINNVGHVVGVSEIDSTGSPEVHAFLWIDGEMTDLGTFSGHSSESSNALDISDPGVIVGASSFYHNSESFEASRACQWRNGQIEDLGHAPGHHFSYATAVNNASQVAGSSTRDYGGEGGFESVLWQDGQVQVLGPIVPDAPNGYRHFTYANDINNYGEIVGYGQTRSSPPPTADGFLWRNGAHTRLSTILPPGWEEWFLAGVAINDAGQIACYGYHLDEPNAHAFILTPPVCRGFVTADANCDGVVNNFDIDALVLGLTDIESWGAQNAACNWLCNLDVNRDGSVNNFDIDPFVACLIAGGCS